MIHVKAKYSMDTRVEEKQDAKDVKSFHILDLYTIDVGEEEDEEDLEELDREAHIPRETKLEIEKMKSWSRTKFFEAASL